MDRAETTLDLARAVVGETLFGWLQVACLPLLFLGPLHPLAPGHPLNPWPTL